MRISCKNAEMHDPSDTCYTRTTEDPNPNGHWLGTRYENNHKALKNLNGGILGFSRKNAKPPCWGYNCKIPGNRVKVIEILGIYQN